MDRRGFLRGAGTAAAAAGAVAVGIRLTKAEVDSRPPATLASVVPGSRHFAVLMDYSGRAIKTMMVDNLPQEIVVDMGREVDPKFVREEKGLPAIGPQRRYCTFRLVSEGRYDGKPVEGLARYIAYQGPVPNWPVVKLGF